MRTTCWPFLFRSRFLSSFPFLVMVRLTYNTTLPAMNHRSVTNNQWPVPTRWVIDQIVKNYLSQQSRFATIYQTIKYNRGLLNGRIFTQLIVIEEKTRVAKCYGYDGIYQCKKMTVRRTMVRSDVCKSWCYC